MDTILESKQCCKFFGGLKAVNCVDIQVKRGEIYGIIGPNGAGKTTFFNVCAGVWPITCGEIWFNGQNITNYPSHKIAKLGIARTFQNIQLFQNLSVLENVLVGFHIRTRTGLFDSIVHSKTYKKDEKFVIEKGLELLQTLNLYQYKDTKAKNLSYGIQRKVEIARALALEPKLLLLDEPAAGMNSIEKMVLLEFIKTINAAGHTVIVIEHDMKFIMNICDRILVMLNGEKLSEGLPAAIRNDPKVIEAYFGKGTTFGMKGE